MESILLIIGIIIIVLLVIVIILLLRKKEDTAKDNELIAKQLTDGRTEQLSQLSTMQTAILGTLIQNFEHITATVDNRVKSMQDSNESRLKEIQGIVDEKLQKTLNDRLTQSFEAVSKQLESVGQGLGEMKTLAADARDLKNALTNVKDRGTYGEVRLEKLLEDILSPSQYVKNANIADRKIVEFAIKLPGSGNNPVLLPIDSKFPIEDYNRLLDSEDKKSIDEARKALLSRIRSFAKDIHDKYIVPPATTDFALMFLPTEGLYAEVIRDAAFFDDLRKTFKVTPVGATTLAAFLSSLQIGFKTLAIEARSEEIANTLGRVKNEFEKFEALLSKARDQIQTVDKTLETMVGTRTRAINRALKSVESIESKDSEQLEL
jgi:DNA recombination protein RmuC